MNNMLPILILFGLLLWYIGTPSSSRGGYQIPHISRSINTQNIKEFEV